MAKPAAYFAEIARRKSGGGAVKVIVTGDKEIDRALRRLGKKAIPVVKKASKKSANRALRLFKNRVAEESGALRESAVVRSMKRSRKSRGAVGHSVVIDRNKLRAKYEAYYGREPGKRKQDSEWFFYPTVVEFGLGSRQPDGSLRWASHGHDTEHRNTFLRELRLLLSIPP